MLGVDRPRRSLPFEISGGDGFGLVYSKCVAEWASRETTDSIVNNRPDSQFSITARRGMRLEEQPTALHVDPAIARFAPLLDIAVCPISKAPLRLVGAAELKDRVTVVDQSKIDSNLVGAFVSEEANRAYSIRGPIVNFLESESL